jgi:valyl-tRNA synthetase
MQWFLQMDTLSKPALENVMNDNIRLVPDKFKNTYRHWMENVHDWCISRQLWWGQRIPAWYDASGDFVVAKTETEARKLFKQKSSAFADDAAIRQDEDVLDTWFSSWLWPISVFDGFKDPNNADIKYYYPTNDLVTAPEILFFWVARMIIAGYEYRGEKPFTNVYLTGIVRDKLGRKMSKSLGNSPEPLELIEKYSADGVRVGMLLTSPAGNDLPFDESLCEQGRNFANKIWNAFRLIHGWQLTAGTGTTDTTDRTAVMNWFASKLNQEIRNIDDLYGKYRISEGLMTLYKLVWDDFCSWYLEMVKPEYGKTMPAEVCEKTVHYFESLLKLLHPFMPFITEEIWHLIRERNDGDCIIVASWPVAGAADESLLKDFNLAADLVTQIRTIRKEKNIPMKEAMRASFVPGPDSGQRQFHGVVQKLCNLSELTSVNEKPSGTIPLLTGSTEYFIFTGNLVNKDAERKKISEELIYTRSFLESVMKKLGNERFVSNAKPEILALEQKKKSDAEAKIRLLEEQLGGM